MKKSFYLLLVEKYKLEYYFHLLLTENTGVNNPYHNNFHTITVFVNSYHIAKSENCSKEQIRTILIAALFHDFNHSGGKKSDQDNIKEAISFFKKNSNESDSTNHSVIEIIKATEYPYTIKEKDLSLEQKIIRDADLTQMYTDNFLQQVIYGLLVQEQGLDFNKAIETQIKFMNYVHPLTKYGNELYTKFMDKRMLDIIYIKKIKNKEYNA